MNIIDGLQQGTPEWHQFRACHFGASEAPAMLGESKHKSRTQLLREKATGIVPEVDAATQHRFDEGHRAEELARPLAESIIGSDLYPVTGEEGKLSASFDGLTLDQSTAWEHKLLNDVLRACVAAADLPICYRIQMEQCLMLSGAARCLFSATKWDDAGNLMEEKHIWYTPDHDLRSRILQGWTQFAIDLENYQHIEHTEKPRAKTIMDLPALSVQATGMVTYSNLPEFKAAAESYIANMNTNLQTDQQFADAEATVKFCKATEEKLEVTKAAILAQTSTIDEVIRTVDHIQAQLRDKRLMLDKLVKSEKEARKIVIVNSAIGAYADHVAGLQAEIAGIQLIPLLPRQDFGAEIKGLKSLKSMHDALDATLANAKITADAVAKDVRAKLAWYNEVISIESGCYGYLFADLQQIIVKPMDDLKLLVDTRIANQKEVEAKRLSADRARIQAEEESKARAKVDAEERAKTAVIDTQLKPVEKSAEIVHIGQSKRPSDADIVRAIIKEFGCTNGQACDWIIETAERIQQAA